MLPRSDTPSSTRALRDTIVALIALLLCIGGAAARETTLPLEPSVSVDLTTTQRESERAAAMRRAADAAALPGAAERVAIVPELGVERQTLDRSLQCHEASLARPPIRQLERVHASIQAVLPHQGAVHHRRAADSEALQLRQRELAGER